jgi:hypothetical protein
LVSPSVYRINCLSILSHFFGYFTIHIMSMIWLSLWWKKKNRDLVEEIGLRCLICSDCTNGFFTFVPSCVPSVSCSFLLIPFFITVVFIDLGSPKTSAMALC